MNRSGIHNPLEDAYNRRNFLRFGGVVAAVVAGAVVDSKLHIISGDSKSDKTSAADKTTQPSNKPVNSTTPPQSSTTLPPRPVADTVATYHTDPSTTTSSSSTTTTTEQAATTTAPPETTLPPGPEYLVVKEPYPLDKNGMIAEVTITNPGDEKPIIGGFLYEADDPNNPRIPLPPKPDGSPADYLTPYINLGPGHSGGTAFPGQEGNCVTFFHRTTHGAPGRRIDEVLPDAVITYTYANPLINPDLLGVSTSYKVIGGPFSIVEADASAYISAQDPSTPAITTVYTCDPPYSAANRLFLKAVFIPPDQPAA